MTTSTVGSRTFPRPSATGLVDRFSTRFASSLAERRANRRYRAQERALAALSRAAHAEALASARRV